MEHETQLPETPQHQFRDCLWEIEKIMEPVREARRMGVDPVFMLEGIAPTLKAKLITAVSLLDQLLGSGNAYSMNILNLADADPFTGHPSYEALVEMIEIAKEAQGTLRQGPTDPPREPAPYIDPLRLGQLRAVKCSEFDLSRLIRICEELEAAHRSRCLLTVGILVRAIIDHIPPVFGAKSFGQVVGSHGNRSFKELMEALDSSSRKIADSYLHSQVRKKESLPTPTQVDFRHSLDALLGEICRVLAEKSQ